MPHYVCLTLQLLTTFKREARLTPKDKSQWEKEQRLDDGQWWFTIPVPHWRKLLNCYSPFQTVHSVKHFPTFTTRWYIKIQLQNNKKGLLHIRMFLFNHVTIHLCFNVWVKDGVEISKSLENPDCASMFQPITAKI